MIDQPKDVLHMFLNFVSNNMLLEVYLAYFIINKYVKKILSLASENSPHFSMPPKLQYDV